MKAVRVAVHEEATSLATCNAEAERKVSLARVEALDAAAVDGGQRIFSPPPCLITTFRGKQGDLAHLSNAADVLLAILGRESEVLVEAEADIVSVEAEGALLALQQLEFESAREGRLAGSCDSRNGARGLQMVSDRAVRARRASTVSIEGLCRASDREKVRLTGETGEPDGDATLTGELLALFLGDALVPDNVLRYRWCHLGSRERKRGFKSEAKRAKSHMSCS
jgi:hypothetical protein